MTSVQVDELLPHSADFSEQDTDRLLGTYIEAHPRLPGIGEARVAGYNVPAWSLIGSLEVERDVDRVVDAFRLPRDAVVAALVFYRRHKPEIDARIAENAIPLAP